MEDKKTGSRIRNWFAGYGLYLAWLVTLAATLGSLFFSEIRHFIPCDLCWYQRIFMFPLAILLGIAAYRNDRAAVVYMLPLSLGGACVALYHYLLQKIPAHIPQPCAGTVPCSDDYLNMFGFVTIPFLSLIAFTLVSVLLLLARKRP